ncbi:excinuclease ABC subunit UvrC [bacterium]|nr:excinuclease ABC subunit UvrC [bacterium]
MSALDEKLKCLPDHPGIYQFFDSAGRILYVGKAVSLNKRVRSYFTGKPDRAKTALLLTKVCDFEIILTDSEVDALLLENNLIKKHRPPFNVELKDDKNYPYVRLDRKQSFPRFEVVRQRKADGARYFGPYPAAGALRNTLGLLNKHFRLRRCRGERFVNRVRPCLNYQMKLCSGPCCDNVSVAEYRRLIASAALILGGRGRPVLQSLKRAMARAVTELNFERAAALRDALIDIELVLESQTIDAGRNEDLDVLGCVSVADGSAALYLLTIRRGNVVGGRPFLLSAYGGVFEDLPGAFLQRHYTGSGAGEVPPPLIIVSAQGEGGQTLALWLGKIRGHRVKLLVPERGRRLQLLRLAEKNAAEFLARQEIDDDFPSRALLELARVCRLKAPPEVVEGVDVSNLQNEGVVASLVCFRSGKASKQEYRRYRLENAPPDDFARMAAVVRRRFSGENYHPFPDLLLLDGGRPQLEAVTRVLKELGISVPLLAIAKGRDEGGNKDQSIPDSFYQPDRKGALGLAVRNPAYRLLQQIRDEAHRFALSYHRLVRKQGRETVLLEVDGVGEKRARHLLKVFGSVEAMTHLSPEKLAEKSAIPMSVAQKVIDFIRI